MTDVNPQTPDATLPSGDPGDETGRRFRYQWTYAAVLSCMLLDETCDVAEVFCEHHEDVLLKHTDASFTGIQVKTRQSDQDVWKTGDPAVKASWARFSRLESDYPGRFRAFRFLTNHPLHSAGNIQDMRHVLETVSGAGRFESCCAHHVVTSTTLLPAESYLPSTRSPARSVAFHLVGPRRDAVGLPAHLRSHLL